MKTKILFAVILVMVAAMTVAPEVSAQEQGEEYTLEEITVTATKRETALEDTPLALSVIAGDTINEQGRSNLLDVLKDIPGLTIEQSVQGGILSIRGLSGAVPIQEGHGDPAVAVNIDGAYTSQFLGVPMELGFYDMARVEVLRGPQGTLYGRNAQGGVLNMVTGDPSDTKEASGTIEIGNYHLLRGTGVVNSPLTEHTALRIAFNLYDRNGYFSAGSGQQNNASGRVKYLYHPSDTFRLLVGGEFTKDASSTAASTYAFGAGDYPAGDPYDNLTKDAGTTGQLPPSGLVDKRYAKVWAQFDWETPIGTVTYIPSYNKSDSKSSTFSKPSGSQLYKQKVTPRKNDQTSFEARLSSSGDSAFDYTLGIFYLNAQMSYWDIINWDIPTSAGGQAVDSLYTVGETSKAIFGQGTYHITDRFRGLLGLRYTKDEKSYFASNPQFGTPGLSSSGAHEWTRTDWKAGLEMDILEDSLVYLDVATGYRPGAVNTFASDTALDPQGQQVPTPDRFTKSEEVTAYEMGAKTLFFDKRLTVNVDVYFNNYKNRQYIEMLFVPGGQTCPNGVRGTYLNETLDLCFAERTINKVETYGGELTSIMHPTNNGTINFSVAYLRSYIAEAQDIYLAGTGEKKNIDGATLPASPKWQVNLSYEHGFDFKPGSLFLRGDGRLQTRSYTQDFSYLGSGTIKVTYPNGYTTRYSYRDMYTNRRHTIYDFTATYLTNEGGYTITAYVKNIFKGYYKLEAQPTPSAAISPPRTYGVTLTARF